MTVLVTRDGCSLSPSRVADGPALFTISNSDAVGVNEVGIARDDVVLAEDETLAPGLSGTIALDLRAGSYSLVCPRYQQSTVDVPLTVVHTDKPPLTAAQTQRVDALHAAVAAYQSYLMAQTSDLFAKSQALAAAIARGDLEGAKAAYAAARVPYERIEPVAEYFPDLDQQIDARPADVPAGISFAGFHRIEQTLWSGAGSTSGLDAYAENLVLDCSILTARVQMLALQPAQLANGAKTLLDEVGATKVTGEEEAYSHLDLIDFQANVDGAQEAYTLLRPALVLDHAALAAQIDPRFTAMDALLDRYRSGSGFVSYATVPADQRRTLSAAVDALAAPLAEVGGALLS